MPLVTWYRMAWRTLCRVLISLGVLIGVIVVSPRVLILVGLLGIVLAVATVAGRHLGPDDAGGSVGASLWRIGTGCLAAVAVLAFGRVLHAYVVPGLLLVAAMSPLALGQLILRYSSETRPAQKRQPIDITTEELCREWCQSYAALRHAPTPRDRLRIVMARQWCLDELERRHPEALHAWLESAASAGGDPARFLHGAGDDETPPAD
jgi:hypothetical protein